MRLKFTPLAIVAGALAVWPVALLLDGPARQAALGHMWPTAALTAMQYATWLGYGGLDIALCLLIAAWAWSRDDRAGTVRGVVGAATVAGAGLLGQVVKNLACRARPTAADAGTFFAQFPCFPAPYALASFPSGHATTAFAAAVLLALWFPRGLPAFIGLAILVALSRVALGAHFPSDVVAGAILGAGAALAAYRRYPALGRPCHSGEGL